MKKKRSLQPPLPLKAIAANLHRFRNHWRLATNQIAYSPQDLFHHHTAVETVPGRHPSMDQARHLGLAGMNERQAQNRHHQQETGSGAIASLPLRS